MRKEGTTYDVAAYIWPSYTGDEPRTRMFWPEGIGEWQSVHHAVKKYPEHNWPRRPLCERIFFWDAKPLSWPPEYSAFGVVKCRLIAACPLVTKRPGKGRGIQPRVQTRGIRTNNENRTPKE